MVEHLAQAYRHPDSPYGRAVVQHRHLDLTVAECRTALAMVLAEAHADLVLARARSGLPSDALTARLHVLAQCSEAELTELHAAGLLDGLNLT
jgi:hypothetical protein